MQRLDRFQRWVMLTAAILVITVAYKLWPVSAAGPSGQPNSQTPYLPIIAIVLSVTAAVIAQLVTDLLFKSLLVRRAIMGRKHVEGHWLLLTNSTDADDVSPLLRPAIAYMSYDTSSQEFRVVSTRLNEKLESYETASEVAHLRTSGPKIRYLNFFKLGADCHTNCYGFSAGEFPPTSAFGSAPNKLSANISVESDGKTRKQSANRIDDSICEQWFKKYGESWLSMYLREVDSSLSVENESDRINALHRLVNPAFGSME